MPRASVHTDLFEIVAIRADGQLLIFLDDYIGNTPVSGAELEVTVDSELGPLAEIAPGVYAADWSPPPGSADITVLVTAGASSDLLLATIEIPDTAKPPQAAFVFGSLASSLAVGQILIAFLIGGTASYLLLQRRRRLPPPAAAGAGSDAFPTAAPAAEGATAGAPAAETDAVPAEAEDNWAPSLVRSSR